MIQFQNDTKKNRTLISFQEIIFRLQKFWAEQGCAIIQPIDIEVGAGTLHHSTILKVVGPKKWRVAFVQPCRRPTDARYGKNPNRLSFYHQFQVIIKPSSSNIQDLYLQSLENIGIDTKNNDIRFIEDDWENPSVGASGLGWEVWFNGMEVSQFTYMQQIGGIPCKMIAAEITYGLERLAMHIQNVDNILDITWNDDQVNVIKFRDLFLQNEIENSAAILEHANIANLFSQFELMENEAKELLVKKLAIPSFEKALKSSHILNLLDAAGAISVAQRADYIARVRNLVKQCCELMEL